MNDVVALLENLINQAASLADEFSPEEMAQILNIFQEAFQFIQEQRPIEPPIPLGTELLWHLSNGNPEAFVNYLRTVPDAALNQLVRNPEQLTSIIQNLSQRFPQAPPEQIGQVETAPFNSSNILGFAYDPQSQQLKVQFQGDGIYQYQGVPPFIFRIFQAGAVPAKTKGQNQYGRWWIGKVPSLGASFYELIRNGGYPYQKVA